jgi:hydroxypyruvate reductase
VPDDASVAGGQAIAELAERLGADDLALVLISGGASALMELPVPGVGLADIRAATDALLRCGATIDELNAVRARVSQLKAGGLARLLAPARVLCLVMSDVLGNPLGVIGSGPCWTGGGAMRDARDVIARYGLAGRMPASVMDRIEAASPGEHARADACDVGHFIIGDIRTALDAAVEAARGLGHRPATLTASMRGEAREIARLIAAMARDLPATRKTNGLDCLILGGEPTVTVLGDGLGGRCQELACAAAPYLDGVDGVALLAAGTDGTDGPTDAAGALVDGSTARRVAELGANIGDALARSDSHHLLEAAGCLIRSGATGSNVGDVVIALLSS